MTKLLPWIIIGLVLRLFLMGWTLHPDIRGHNLAAYLIAQKHEVFTFYDHMRLLPRNDPLVILYHDDIFAYPPLAYLTHALFNFFLYPLYPQSLFQTLIIDIGKTAHAPQLPWLLFLLKFPYLIADILGFFVWRKLLDPKHKLLGSLLWIFNPVTLYSAYMLSQFDIYIVLFLLLALAYPKAGAFFIAVAASYKPFPLFLLPFLPGSKIKNISIGIAVYVGLMAPYLRSVGFRQYALLASQTDKIIYARLPISGAQYIPLFFFGLMGLFWWNYFRPKSLPLWAWLGAVFLLFYSVTHFHPQWFTWGSPFLLLALLYVPRSRFPILVLFGAYVLTTFLFEPSLTFGLFGINFDLAHALSVHYPPDQLASLARAALAGSAIAVVGLETL